MEFFLAIIIIIIIIIFCSLFQLPYRISKTKTAFSIKLSHKMGHIKI